MNGSKLVDGEVTGGEVTDVVFPTLLHTYWYPRFARSITRASSPASMAGRRRRTVVLRPSSAMAWPGEHGYGIYEP